MLKVGIFFKAYISRPFILPIFFIFITGFAVQAQDKTTLSFNLQNEHIRLTVQVQNNRLVSETISAEAGQNAFFNGASPSLTTDGDFALDVMWADWQAPGMKNNAENPVLLSKMNFRLVRGKTSKKNGVQELTLDLQGQHIPIVLQICYRLAPGDFFLKKQISACDTSFGFHFLRHFYPVYSMLDGKSEVIKTGGFGQPIAFENEHGGYFVGLEYPAAQNIFEANRIRCSVEVGKKITASPIESGWTVLALTPKHLQKLWFFKYLQSIRISPLRPYTLYNSWYDLRSAQYPNVPKSNIMNEQNVLRIIDLIKTNFVQKNHIHLDAFVLDDGWDNPKSNWQLNKTYFPNGLQSIRKKLDGLHTKLGLWLGPMGGYDFRNERIAWMEKQGFEVVGGFELLGKDGLKSRILCLAGKNYSQLIKQRTTDLVDKDGVRFFKWDGIQFSCSEPVHGHPIGLYSRRAVLDTLIGLTKAVRAKHPDVFLNITSGTWLSPWWVQYANQIWMSGGDYGYSEVPSVSRRDAAMTFRDIVLYQDFKVNDFWMPVANLMTHGIIKGNMQKLGAKEPIDKFTNNALLYFARGVSMWELYISPDILTDDEWSAISQSLHWAKENFDILKHTEMVGGNPGAKEAYAYVHFNGSKGIIAARNPFIAKKELTITLAEKYNVSPQAKNLVLERVYPTRWIDPHLYAAGERVTLSLDGFETAVYQLYPLKEATEPLLAGVIFNEQIEGTTATFNILHNAGQARLLNPRIVQSAVLEGKTVDADRLKIKSDTAAQPVSKPTFRKEKENILHADFTLQGSLADARFLLLLEQTSAQESTLPQVKILRAGKELTAQVEKQDGQWAWYAVDIPKGNVDLQIVLHPNKNVWQGKASAWVIAKTLPKGQTLVLLTGKKMQARALPPKPWPDGAQSQTVKLGMLKLIVQ